MLLERGVASVRITKKKKKRPSAWRRALERGVASERAKNEKEKRGNNREKRPSARRRALERGVASVRTSDACIRSSSDSPPGLVQGLGCRV